MEITELGQDYLSYLSLKYGFLFLLFFGLGVLGILCGILGARRYTEFNPEFLVGIVLLTVSLVVASKWVEVHTTPHMLLYESEKGGKYLKFDKPKEGRWK